MCFSADPLKWNQRQNVYAAAKAGERMRRVIIDMQNYLFADAIALALRDSDSDFDVYRAEAPEDAAELCALSQPYALLAEVVASPPRTLEDRLKLREEVRRQAPGCRIVLAVDENADSRTARKVRQAKKDGLIDQFIYGSISAGYLAALMDTL